MFHLVYVNILQRFDRVIGTIISGGVGNVMKGDLNLSKATTCFNR